MPSFTYHQLEQDGSPRLSTEYEIDQAKEGLLRRSVGSEEALLSTARVHRHGFERFLKWQSLSVLLNITLVVAVVVMAVALQRFEKLCQAEDRRDNDIIRATSETSPIIDDMQITLSKKWRNASFVGEINPEVIYRQEASDEVDAAWLRLSNINPVAITAEHVSQLGYDPAKMAKFPPEFGLGPDAYVARIEVFHQIHCLNWLRKELHFDYYFGDKFPDGVPNASHRSHQYHCLFILLEGLMCSSNVTPYLHYWSDAQREPFPDFNNRHVCRDFDAILEWQEANSVDQGYFVEHVERPEGVEPVRMSDRFKAIQKINEP